MDFRVTRLSGLLTRKTFPAALAFSLALCPLTATEAQAQNDGTSQIQYGDVSQLPGIDPSAERSVYTYNGGKNSAPTDGEKLLCFYNVGANKFLSIGGLWGTHASLNTSPHALWIEMKDGAYYIANKVAGSGTGNHVGLKGGDVYMDFGLQGTGGYVRAITFEKSSSYTDTNKTYLLKLGTDGYLTAYPSNENKYCNYQKTAYATTSADYKNQEWKIITRDEYYQLTRTIPANMASVVDFTFLINSPDFRVNDTDIANWKIGRQSQNPDIKNKLMLGDNVMYSVYDRVGSSNNSYRWIDTNTGKNTYNSAHQQNYGKFFYCYAKGQHNFYLYQDITVHKAGWYVLRCNGFSTQQETNAKGGVHPLAYLFTAEVKGSDADWTTSSSATINLIGRDEANALTASKDGTGAGQAFFEGKYDNQVQLCVEKAYDDSGNEYEVSEEHPATLRIGFLVDKYSDAADDLHADDITAVDNFKLYYAGPRRNPELILDEDNNNLLYLSQATDEYKNSVLHLHRTFNDHKWNSLVLPVSLTFGQMKRTFGDDVKVARLQAITNSSIQFVTVEPESDDDVMVKAFEPYIVKPPVINTSSAAYTIEHFYTGSTDDNSQWLNAACNGSSTDENDRFTLTIPKDHYIITMVSLDRTLFNDKMNTENWVSQTTSSASGALGQLVCYGTMAKTFNSNGILPGRDDLTGDYFFYKGDILQVPSGKVRGLQGFRCWFELKGSDLPAGSRRMELFVDGVADGSATAIDDITGPGTFTSRRRGLDGVYSLDGQLLRHGTSTEGLPKGIYISDGRKVVVR